ncbi:hypothetical protein QT982_31145 [Microcoleus sp. herbarium2]
MSIRQSRCPLNIHTFIQPIAHQRPVTASGGDILQLNRAIVTATQYHLTIRAKHYRRDPTRMFVRHF